MRIRCPHCQAKAIITHTVPATARITELYANCTGPQCGARFVARLSYAYTLTPPESTLTDSLHEQLAHLDPKIRRELLRQYADELPLFSTART